MKRLKYVAVTCVAACALSGAIASAAQAVTIGPAGQTFKAESKNSELKFMGVGVKCTKSNAEGKTNNPVTSTASLTSLTFTGTCTTTIGGSTVKSVTTSGFPWTITAETATGGGSGTGSITIPTGGKAVIVTSGVLANCEITVGPQANKKTLTLNHAANELLANVSLSATAVNTGGGCLIAGSGTATFTGNYPISVGSPEINP
jgi:hypothetical protein